MIIAENLVKEFVRTEKEGRKKVKKAFNAVDNVSVKANDSETLGILGPNGAGKTTLLRMLGTLMEPTGGTVTHYRKDGSVIESSEEVKEKLGYLSNNTKLYEKFTVREFLELMGSVYGFSKEVTEKRIEAVEKTMNLTEFMDMRIKSLSTGQTQRVSIARCLFPDPDMYILDEPTLGLDIMSAQMVVDFMKEEKKKGKSIIYSTHYMEEAQELCDRIILLDRGHIIAIGTPEELMKSSNTNSLREAFLSYINREEADA